MFFDFILQSCEFDFVVVSLHIDAIHLKNRNKKETRSIDDEIMEDEPDSTEETRSDTEVSQLAPLVTALKEKLISERNIILFGDFGLHPDDAGELLSWRVTSVALINVFCQLFGILINDYCLADVSKNSSWVQQVKR